MISTPHRVGQMPALGPPLPPMPQRLGRYVIDRMVAAGGMGSVYLAHVEGPAGFVKTVVVKCIRQPLEAEHDSVGLFLNEARLAALLAHPNIVQTFELGEDHGVYFQAMEYVDGPNLRELHRELYERGERLPVAVAAHACAQVLHALSHAHGFRDPSGASRPILHRDVSPENVILSAGGTVKVADFGIARMTRPGARTTGLMRGKVAYMAPERLRSGETVDARCDLFSVGVMLYELLADVRPFAGATPLAVAQAILRDPPEPLRQRRSDVPEALAELVHRAIARNPCDRFDSAVDFAAALESFATRTGALVTQGQMAGLAQSVERRPQRGPTRPMAGSDERPTSPGSVEPALAELDALELMPFASQQLEALPVEVETPEQPPTVLARAPSARLKAAGVALASGLLVGVVLGAVSVLRPKAAASPAPAPTPQVTARVTAAEPSPPLVLEADGADLEPLKAARPAAPKAARAQPAGKGVVELRVHPWADTWVDGKKLGQTPLEPFELGSGKHQLRLVNDELQVDRTVHFWLNARSELQLGVNLLTHKVTQETAARDR